MGELVRAAVAEGARTVYLGLGGSATNDGGAGFLQALGAELVQKDGAPLAPGLAGLERAAHIDLAPARRLIAGVELIALADVRSPLLGPPRCAARVWSAEGDAPGRARVSRRPSAG